MQDETARDLTNLFFYKLSVSKRSLKLSLSSIPNFLIPTEVLLRQNRYGQVWIGGFWNLAIYRRGVSTGSSWTMDRSLPKGPWCSKFWLCPGLWFPLCVFVCGEWGRGWWDSVSWCSWRSKFSLWCVLCLHDLCFWSVISEKQLIILLVWHHFELVLW